MDEITIPASTTDVLARSTFRRAGVFTWARASRVGDPTRHLLVIRDERETTVVTRDEALSDLDVIATNPDRWLLLAIDCASPFYCVGFVAKISSSLTAAGLDILFTSTFSRDLVFVKESEADRAEQALLAAGLTRA